MQKDHLICDYERRIRRSASPWRTWQRQIQSTPRLAKIALLIVVICCATAGFFRGLRDIHDQWVKQYPTDFSTLDATDSTLSPPERPFRQLHGPSIDDRYLYIKPLGKGQEGSTSVYVDVEDGDEVVIKTFDNRARNSLPQQLSHGFEGVTRSWPTEIEAGLLFGSGSNNESSYVPVRDFFILREEDSWSWALVTPFIKSGTLLSLAKQECRHGVKSIAELDLEYRPSILNLLRGLEHLHGASLCHDDVKPDNIFIESDTHWLLGDLGNVRETDHAWHETASWVRQNQWRDCQTNDIRRAIKSYLWFLRSAVTDTEGFDHEFWAAETSWSRLYWDYTRSRATVGRLLDRLASSGSDTLQGQTISSEVYHSPAELSRDTERELLCTSIPYRLWRRWWWLPGG